jgi:hypothetical protein
MTSPFTQRKMMSIGIDELGSHLRWVKQNNPSLQGIEIGKFSFSPYGWGREGIGQSTRRNTHLKHSTPCKQVPPPRFFQFISRRRAWTLTKPRIEAQALKVSYWPLQTKSKESQYIPKKEPAWAIV